MRKQAGAAPARTTGRNGIGRAGRDRAATNLALYHAGKKLLPVIAEDGRESLRFRRSQPHRNRTRENAHKNGSGEGEGRFFYPRI
jgi:hypothetical protein